MACALFLAVAGLPNECRVTTTSLAFGAYDTFAGFPADATGEITVTCQGAGAAHAPRIRLDRDGPSRGSLAPRRMRAARGTASLAYELYRNAARTEVWGDGTGSTLTVEGMGRHVVYGRIPPLQSVPPGEYADTVTVTVDW
jgi:spore coat protein U-like protein